MRNRMAKYMVMVNSKFMISVEAESLNGAEHVILDQFADSINRHGSITSAQAFGKDEMKTSFFFECMMDCETISLDGLSSKIKVFEDLFEALSNEGDTIDYNEKMIAYYEDAIVSLRNSTEEARARKEKLLRKVRDKRDELNAR